MMRYEYIVKAIERLGNNQIVLRLFPKNKKMEFKPGQFVKLSNKEIGRPYSIASPPSWDYLEFLIKLVGGSFTSYLEKIEIGEELYVEGPAGHMIFNSEEKAVFIAAGTGIAPMMSMLRHIYSSKELRDGEYYLFYSVRRVDAIAFLDEIELFKSFGLNAIITLTREEEKKFEHGRISIEMIDKYLNNRYEEFSFFICGKNAMVNTLKASLIERKAKAVKVEGWG